MSELADAVRAAQTQAERHFGDGPVTPWEAPSSPARASRPKPGWAAGAVLPSMIGLIAMAMAGARQSEPAGVVVEPALALEPAASSRPSEEAPGFDDAAPSVVEPASMQLGRVGATWHLDARGVSRLEAAQRLAEASGSTLHGSLEALAGARPLHLQWQGRSLAEAWSRLLGSELNYALQCRAERCQAWIVGTAGTVAPTAVPAAGPVSPNEPLLPMPDEADDEASRRD
jgi:hypothetical protein